MEVTKLNNRILKYRLYDNSNGAVLIYTLDLDRFELQVSGETTGSYKWVNTEPHETFIQLLTRADSGYLCDKLFEKHYSNTEAIEAALDDLEVYKDELENYEKIVERIKNIYADSAVEFKNQLEEIIWYEADDLYEPDSNIIFQDFYEHDLDEYGYWEEKSIKLFKEYIVPELVKEN